MATTRANLRSKIRENLADVGVTFYTDAEINDSIQDCYNEIAAKCRCFPKKSSGFTHLIETNYYDFRGLGITDFMGTIAIFNNNTNFYLRDDISLRDLDKIRRDWELWKGEPQFWVPHSLKYTVLVPQITTDLGRGITLPGNFDLYYWASAPTLGSDGASTLIADDADSIFEVWCLWDLLMSAKEPTKAKIALAQAKSQMEKYKARCANMAKYDLLLRA